MCQETVEAFVPLNAFGGERLDRVLNGTIEYLDQAIPLRIVDGRTIVSDIAIG